MNELDAYDYDLPPERIAQYPLAQRADSRLLVVRRATQAIEHAHVRELPEFLAPHDCLVLNDTKVLPARLVGFRTATGGRWQGLFLSQDAQGAWLVLGRTRGKLQPGETVTIEGRTGREKVELTVLAKLSEGRWAFRPNSTESTWDLLERVGRVPLPPYIRGGEMEEPDQQRYQTVFARQPGAVAAPTAGLHFTPDLLRRVGELGVTSEHVTLHVGIGTFRPIIAERLSEHVMHHEWGSLSAETAQRINARRRAGGRLVAVGTTVVRVLETAAKAAEEAKAAATFEASGETLAAWEGETNLFIRPPFTFRAVDVLFTNFHLPKSTLLVLVRTFGGDELLRRAYEEAIREEYRFFSYGDAMLIL